MDNRTLLKWLHAALAIGALILFLAAPFISYGGKYDMTGADMLDRMGDDDVWLVLFIITPLIAALTNLSDNKALRGIVSLAMLLPIVILLGKTGNNSRMELAPGGIIYILLAIGMTILAFSTPDDSPSSQEETDEQRTDSDSSMTKSDALAEEIREYEDEKLNEIVTNPALYKASLVEACRRELEIRSRSAEFTAQVRAMDNEKLHEVLSSPQLYAEELIYACTLEQTERRRVWREEEAKQEELRRLRREQEEKEAAERRAAAWKKWRPYVFAAVAVFLASVGAGIYVPTIYKNYQEGFYSKNAYECYEQGRCYAFGHGGVPHRDMNRAVEWYTRAAKKGNIPAQNALGNCYELGNGVSRNIHKAVKYYRMAAESGFAPAQTNLAECYEKGKGVTKNRTEARGWYQKAAEQGNETGRQGLLRCSR